MYNFVVDIGSTDESQKTVFTLATFVATVAGVTCSVAVVFCVAGVAVGCIMGVHWSNRKFQNPSTSGGVSSPTGEARGQVMPEYEEISLQEIKDLQLTSNTAYGIKP